jgi:hypothetical protein
VGGDESKRKSMWKPSPMYKKDGTCLGEAHIHVTHSNQP